MKQFRLLDLFCGQGGASMGYRQAGFEVVGVDAHDQPLYPFEFHQCSVFQYMRTFPQHFDAIHASPPCQHYSVTKNLYDGRTVDLVAQTREVLKTTGLPYIIENVPQAPLENTVLLCGQMFGLRVLRHRLFETNFLVEQPEHPKHSANRKSQNYTTFDTGEYITVAGNMFRADEGRIAMECPWMTKKGLAQAIPPAYTAYIGAQLIKHLLSQGKE